MGQSEIGVRIRVRILELSSSSSQFSDSIITSHGVREHSNSGGRTVRAGSAGSKMLKVVRYDISIAT